jgi:hypothetical protein
LTPHLPIATQSPQRRSRRRLVLFGMMAGLLGLLVAIGAVELLLRSYDPLPHPLTDIRGLYTVDAEGRIRLQPGWRGQQRIEDRWVPIAIDSLGLRGPELAAKRPGERRLLVVGDSFVFGQGVAADEAMPAQLQAALHRRGLDVTVGNGGIAGTGPREWRGMAERVRAGFGTDAVLAVSFLGNDVLDTLQEPLTAVDGWLLSAGFAKQARESWRFRLRVASRLWDKVELALGRLPLLALGQAEAIGPGVALADALFLDRDPSRDHELPFLAEVQAKLGRAFDDFAVATRGMPTVVVLAPPRTVLLQDYAQLLAANHLDPSLHQRGFRVLDLLEPLLARADRAALYLPVDGHWNAQGCAVVAELLAAEAAALLR